MSQCPVLVCGWIAASVALAAAADALGPQPGDSEWPIFRGDAALKGIADAELSDNPQLQWSFATEGPVKSSPVIGGGRVFIGSDDGHLYALELATGEKLWAFETELPVEAPPALHDATVVVGSTDGRLYALAAETGELKWTYETDDQIVGAPNILLGEGEEPTLVIVGSHDTYLHAVELETGERAWKYQTDNFVVAAPTIDEGRTVFGGCDGFLHVVSLRDGEAIEQIDIGAYVGGSAALVGRRVYLGHYGNEFVCVDLDDKEVVWTYRDRNFPYFSSPAVADDMIVFGGRDRRLHAVDRETGEGRWTFNTRARVDSSPVVAGDRVVVGSSDGRVYIVDLDDGSEVWSYEIGDAITGSPGVVDGLFVIGSEDGSVYAFGESPD